MINQNVRKTMIVGTSQAWDTLVSGFITSGPVLDRQIWSAPLCFAFIIAKSMGGVFAGVWATISSCRAFHSPHSHPSVKLCLRYTKFVLLFLPFRHLTFRPTETYKEGYSLAKDCSFSRLPLLYRSTVEGEMSQIYAVFPHRQL